MLSDSPSNPEQGLAFQIPLGRRKTMEADLLLPQTPFGVAVVAHGCGSCRRSPRNWKIARVLRELGFASLLIDLLTTETEGATPAESERLAIDAAERVIAAAEWLHGQPDTSVLPVGYYGAGTGAASALVAAARRPDMVDAVVARSGRTELAHSHLPEVAAPTLLIVGSHDLPVVHLNRSALNRLGSIQKEMQIVPGASHLFEEPGALNAAAIHAANWFARHLAGFDSATVNNALLARV